MEDMINQSGKCKTETLNDTVYGEVEEGLVIVDKSKGYGFVTFKRVDGAVKALVDPSKKIDGSWRLLEMLRIIIMLRIGRALATVNSVGNPLTLVVPDRSGTEKDSMEYIRRKNLSLKVHFLVVVGVSLAVLEGKGDCAYGIIDSVYSIVAMLAVGLALASSR
nr:UBP1-associated protein 2C-like [Tanacetum cinerariifolium]